MSKERGPLPRIEFERQDGELFRRVTVEWENGESFRASIEGDRMYIEALNEAGETLWYADTIPVEFIDALGALKRLELPERTSEPC